MEIEFKGGLCSAVNFFLFSSAVNVFFLLSSAMNVFLFSSAVNIFLFSSAVNVFLLFSSVVVFFLFSSAVNVFFLLSSGCVDVWEPKVLQMGRGAHFDISIETNLDWKEIDEALPKDCSIYLADSSPHLDGRDVSDDKNDRNNESNSRQYRGFEYDCIDYCNDHSVVVIGGETNGISSAAFDMFSRMRKRPGCRIHVPMMSGIDSLNSAIASSIILFEIGRQMKLHSHKQ